MVVNNLGGLSNQAERWLASQSNPTRTIEQLIELAAGKSYLALKIAKSLDLPHPDRVSSKTLGAPERVLDETLIGLQSEGLTYAEISDRVGLSPTQVGKRIRKIKKRKSNEL